MRASLNRSSVSLCTAQQIVVRAILKFWLTRAHRKDMLEPRRRDRGLYLEGLVSMVIILVSNDSQLASAIRTAGTGDTISLASGTYNLSVLGENLSGRQSRAASGANVTFSQMSIDDVQNLTIKDVTISGGGSGTGFLLQRSDNITLENSTIKGFEVGAIVERDRQSLIPQQHHLRHRPRRHEVVRYSRCDDFGELRQPEQHKRGQALIPAAINHDTCAQARLETEVTRAGSATKSFQAWQQASTMAR